MVAELYELVAQAVANERITILLVEQFAQTALAIADHAGVMVNGRIVRQAPLTRWPTTSSRRTWARPADAGCGARLAPPAGPAQTGPAQAGAPTSSSLTLHRRAAASSSRAALDGVRALHFTK